VFVPSVSPSNVLLFARVADTLSAHGHRVLAYVPDQR
jgi:hypothetical protein